jgi:hypothetical protein
MRFLRAIAGYRTDHIRNQTTRQKLNILNILVKMVEYETNWSTPLEEWMKSDW